MSSTLFAPLSRLVSLRGRALAAAGVLALCAACGGGGAEGSGSEAAAPGPSQPARLASGDWVLMGSSTAAGAGASSGRSFAALLAQGMGSGGMLAAQQGRLQNIALGGTTTYQGLPALSPRAVDRPASLPNNNLDKALSLKPALLIIAYPSNDTAMRYTVQETVSNILLMVQTAKQQGVPSIVLSTQPRDMLPALQEQLVQIDAQLEAALGACLVRVREALAGPDGRIAPAYAFGDGVHLNDAGHALLHGALLKRLQQGSCVRLAQ
ncbi:SGNH/GDSL hydrolase family protein [Roseateles sp. BYS180W]|uniref:SGNH/GDSL hydrolase family protein n=1 Tax=Roseateles rivi TaxID=3299028 RepID=A0ABW7FZC2_9BURK